MLWRCILLASLAYSPVRRIGQESRHLPSNIPTTGASLTWSPINETQSAGAAASVIDPNIADVEPTSFFGYFTGPKNEKMMWWRTVAIVFLGSIFSSVFIGFYGLGHPSPQVQTYTLTAMGSAFSILCAICSCKPVFKKFQIII